MNLKTNGVRLIVALAAGLLVQSAQAADIESVSDWSGAYVGLQGGATFLDVDLTRIPQLDVEPFNTDTGYVFGGHAGYAKQFDGFVLGVEGDAEVWSQEGDDNTNFGALDAIDGQWLGSLRARAGIPVDNFLLYVTGGAQYANLDINQSSVLPPRNESNNYSVWGWTVGGGADVQLTDTVRMGLEYRYMDLGKIDTPLNTVTGAKEFDLGGMHSVRLRVSVNF
jgi:outer membrane immunogenic protein